MDFTLTVYYEQLIINPMVQASPDMPELTVSIALATYNGARFLQEQLASILSQTVLPNELVVGDDGSIDETLAILDDFKNGAPFPVFIHRNESNLGFSDNFLKTASKCRSQWIAFCDQDDLWDPRKLERCLEEACRPGVVLVIHNGRSVNEWGKDLGQWIQPGLDKRVQTSRLFAMNRAGAGAGLYVIEDTQTSYWVEFRGFNWGGSRDLNAKGTTMNFFKSLVDGLNYSEYLDPDYQANYYDLNIVGIHFYHNLIFIQKGSNNEPSITERW